MIEFVLVFMMGVRVIDQTQVFNNIDRCLYFAERFGDSTISKILNHRNKLGVLYFESAFKKYTGIKLKQFNEDWRRHMNTFYFGQRSSARIDGSVELKGLKSACIESTNDPCFYNCSASHFFDSESGFLHCKPWPKYH